jgi:ABC-type amino acid transport substrate-binding protein
LPASPPLGRRRKVEIGATHCKAVACSEGLGVSLKSFSSLNQSLAPLSLGGSTRCLRRSFLRSFFPSLGAAALLCGLWLGCAGSNFSLSGETPLRVGVSPDYPPVIFESGGEIVGIEADLARIVSESLGRPIEYTRLPFQDLLPALERGEIDVVMSGLSITPERAERVDFTTPYMKVGQLALIRSRDLARFGRFQGLRRSGARVGYQLGSSGERYVHQELPRAASFGFEDVDAGLRSLRADRIDYFIHDAPTVWRIAGDLRQRDLHGLYRPLTQEDIAWAVRKDAESLRALLNATVAHWQREGLIDPIVQRWIPVRVTTR